MNLKTYLTTLDALTDAEADNLRTAKRQGDLPEHMEFTWAVVEDSVRQMPEDVLAQFGSPDALRDALTRVAAVVGQEASVEATYALPDYAALGQDTEEVFLLARHDLHEELHPFVALMNGDSPFCKECGDTEEGLMHNNTWRNVEPLMDEDDEPQGTLSGIPGPPVPQTTDDPHADFHQRSMLPMPSSLCTTCNAVTYEASSPEQKAADALAVLPLPVVAVSEDAGLDGLGTVLGNLTGLAFDLTTLDGEVSGELVAVSYLAAMGDYRLTLKDVDTEQTASVLLSGVTKIVYS